MKRHALVTGGNRGIGLATCEALARQGISVGMGCRDVESGMQIAAKLTAEGLDVRPIRLDLEDDACIRLAVKELAHEDFPVDILVHNAGVLTPCSALTASRESMDQAWRVHVTGPLYLSQLLIPDMVDRGYGRIVFVSSGWGSFASGLAGPAPYSITKAALNALTVKLDQDTPDTVLVNAVCPGWVRTRMGGMEADRSPAEGADTVVHAATLPDGGVSGQLLRDRQVAAF